MRLYWFSYGIQLYNSMLFEAQWVITTLKGQSNISILIDALTEDVVRTICAKHSIAVFSVVPYEKMASTFGKVYFRFHDEWEDFTAYTQYEKAKDAYGFFREAWFKISYINNSDHPLSDEDVVRVIEKLENDYAKAHDTTSKDNKNYFEQITDLVVKKWWKELDDLKLYATKAVEEADSLLQKIQWTQANVVIKIKNAEDELKKAKLGTNIAKIRERIGELYTLMEHAELDYLEWQKEHEMQIAEWSIITYLDIVAEWERYKKSKNIQQAGAYKSANDTYYMFFWAVWLYQKLLWKDIQNKFKDVIIILDTLYNIIVIFILMTMIWLVLLQLFNSVIHDAYFFTTSFIDIGIMGICSALLMQFKKPELLRLIIIGPLCVLLYFLLRSMIYANFWL